MEPDDGRYASRETDHRGERELAPVRIPVWVFWLAAALLGPTLVGLGGKWLYSLRPLPTPRLPDQTAVSRSSKAWERIPVGHERCYLANNVWNTDTSDSRLEQEIFVLEDSNAPDFGWRWRSAWEMFPAIVAYPEVVCGVKPWDTPMGSMAGFPFHPGEGGRLTADFHIQLEAEGTYNMAFSLWAVSDLPATPENIRTEIMIWNVNAGQRPSGVRRGDVTVGGVTYEVWVNERQHDAAGRFKGTWTYVAFVARKRVLDGPLEVSAFLDYALREKLLTPEMYVTDLELGNEVAQGAGLAEVRGFRLKFEK